MITDRLEIVNSLCKSCGACKMVCPVGCIDMARISGDMEVPRIDRDQCVKCKLCFHVCPASPRNTEALLADRRTALARYPDVSLDDLIGPYRAAYRGKSTNEQIRIDAASGGIVSAVLLYALDAGLIDAALVVRESQAKPLQAEPVLARTPHEVLAARGSRYQPVANLKLLRHVLRGNMRGVKKLAVVGLPCQIEGLCLGIAKLKGLRERVQFTISLFCKQTKTLGYQEAILGRMGLNKEEISSIRFRGNGWPGTIIATTRDGEERGVPYVSGAPFFWMHGHAPVCCMFCCDSTGEMADISVGDNWLEWNESGGGQSLILGRTETGCRILETMRQRSLLEVSEIPGTSVVNALDPPYVRARKHNWPNRLRFYARLSSDPLVKEEAERSRRCAPTLDALVIFALRSVASSRFYNWLFAKGGHAFNFRLGQEAHFYICQASELRPCQFIRCAAKRLVRQVYQLVRRFTWNLFLQRSQAQERSHGSIYDLPDVIYYPTRGEPKERHL